MTVFENPRVHLHLNGVALLLISLIAYGLSGGSWWLFFGLLLAPDLFMVGYVSGPRTGAAVYNFGHSLVWPAGLIGAGLIAAAATGNPSPLPVQLGLIWAAHIGMDRAVGFGYKYPTHFKDTDIARA